MLVRNDLNFEGLKRRDQCLDVVGVVVLAHGILICEHFDEYALVIRGARVDAPMHEPYLSRESALRILKDGIQGSRGLGINPQPDNFGD
nr:MULTISPECIES: hypothetical protein [unclassified Microbacterium]